MVYHFFFDRVTSYEENIIRLESRLLGTETFIMKPGNELSAQTRNKYPNMDTKRIPHYHTTPQYTLKIYSFGKHCEKGEIACIKQFLLFSQCFLPYMVLILYFKCTLKCCLQFVLTWIGLKFYRLVMC